MKLIETIQAQSYQTRRTILIACTAVTSLLVIGVLVITIKPMGESFSSKEQASGEPSAWETFKEKSLASWKELREGVGDATENIAGMMATPVSTSTATGTAQTYSSFLTQLEEALQQEAITQ